MVAVAAREPLEDGELLDRRRTLGEEGADQLLAAVVRKERKQVGNVAR
jgi:hypothetical protein